jgi:hypothetical protein
VQACKGPLEFLELFFAKRAKSPAGRLKERIPRRVFIASKKFRIDQEPELVTGPVQHCFGKSAAVVKEESLSKRFSYGSLDRELLEFSALAGGERLEFDIYTLQVQDVFGAQRTGENVQTRYFPVAGMYSFGKLMPCATRPVVNAVEERIHGVLKLVEVAAREEPSALFLLTSDLLSPQPCSTDVFSVAGNPANGM